MSMPERVVIVEPGERIRIQIKPHRFVPSGNLCQTCGQGKWAGVMRDKPLHFIVTPL